MRLISSEKKSPPQFVFNSDLPSAQRPLYARIRTRAARVWNSIRTALAWPIFFGQILNKGVSATFKLNGFGEHLIIGGHHANIPWAVKVPLIAMRALCVAFVSAGNTLRRMSDLNLDINDLANKEETGQQFYWITRYRHEATEVLNLTGKKCWLYVTARLAEQPKPTENNAIKLRNRLLAQLYVDLDQDTPTETFRWYQWRAKGRAKQARIDNAFLGFCQENIESELPSLASPAKTTNLCREFATQQCLYNIGHALLQADEEGKPVAIDLDKPSPELLAIIKKESEFYNLHFSSTEDQEDGRERLTAYLKEFSESNKQNSLQANNILLEQLKPFADIDWRMRQRYLDKKHQLDLKYKLLLTPKQKMEIDKNLVEETSKEIKDLHLESDNDLQKKYHRLVLLVKHFDAIDNEILILKDNTEKQRRYKKDYGYESIHINQSSSLAELKKSLSNAKRLAALDITLKEFVTSQLTKDPKQSQDDALTGALKDLKNACEIKTGDEDLLKESFKAQKAVYLLNLACLKKRLIKKAEEEAVVVAESQMLVQSEREGLDKLYNDSLTNMIIEQQRQRNLLHIFGIKDSNISAYIEKQNEITKKHHAFFAGKWEKRFSKSAIGIALVNVLVFTSLSLYGAMTTFSPLVVFGGAIALTTIIGIVTSFISWYFGAGKITESFSRVGRHYDKRANKKRKLEKESKSFLKGFLVFLMACSFAPLQLLAITGPLTKLLLISGFAASAATPIGWTIGIILVAITTVASALLLQKQIKKLFAHTTESVWKHSTLYKEAKAKGGRAVAWHWLKVSIGLTLALVTTAIAAMGDYFGIHTLLPIITFDVVMMTLSLSGNLCQNISDTTSGMVKAINKLGKTWIGKKLSAVWDYFTGCSTCCSETMSELPEETKTTVEEILDGLGEPKKTQDAGHDQTSVQSDFSRVFAMNAVRPRGVGNAIYGAGTNLPSFTKL
ncbi:MAG: hypothetical protein DHS20C10_11180 [marine bacterium B5-7]|nr:MAG: hypothetical protein DHS20C10_11180 [marine bacterium B5-7]